MQSCLIYIFYLSLSRTYVDAITSKIDSIRLNTKVTSITRTSTSDGVQITVNDKNNVGETYDYVIFATHADQALEILGSEATENEKRILGNFQFSKNKAVLHSDLEVTIELRIVETTECFIRLSC